MSVQHTGWLRVVLLVALLLSSGCGPSKEQQAVAGGDLAIGANSVTDVSLEKVNDCSTIVEERQAEANFANGKELGYEPE